jgi:hypothetical protein
MPRYSLLLLSCVILGCTPPDAITEPAEICPCVRFRLVEIDHKALPYTPPDPTGAYNPHALLSDSLNFNYDGIVNQISVIRTIEKNGDTTVITRRKSGFYDLSNLPVVMIDWDEAGIFLYGLRNDTLGVAVNKTGEHWKYKLVRVSLPDTTANRWMSAPYQP